MSDNSTIEVRNLRISDYEELNEIALRTYGNMDNAAWERSQIKRLLNIFPEGQVCVEVDNKIVAAALAIIVDYDQFGDNHTYDQITDNYSFRTHNPKGDVLYGIDVFVDPDYRGMRLGRRLYDTRKELCENLKLKAIVAGGRIPNYAKYAKEMTPRQYIEKVKHREIHDPTLNFQLSNDFHVRKVLKNYLPEDKESKEYATLLEWNNIYYQEVEKLINLRKSVIRVGLVQWQMRLFKDLEEFMVQAEYFVDAVSSYQSDFVIFPEFFNAPLMAEFDHLGEAKACRELAQYTEIIREKFESLAMTYNINIITGSMPLLDDNTLYNVSYLCHRNGSWDDYYKVHITPSERDAWGMEGGSKVKVIDTDCGKVGILICYDVEFPELARLYAKQGMKLLFVPFLTDTQNGFNRVRSCAMARAVENECYVAIAGAVGNLPQVNNMDIQYAQSAIFTPSDFAFPLNGIKAEATPNAEMIIIADLDLELLKELHEFGSVNVMKDRRTDLYDVINKKKSK